MCVDQLMELESQLKVLDEERHLYPFAAESGEDFDVMRMCTYTLSRSAIVVKVLSREN